MKLYSLTREGDSIVKSCSDVYDLLFKNRRYEEECEIFVITPHQYNKEFVNNDHVLLQIIKAWIEINSLKKGKIAEAWGKILFFADEVIPGSKIFKLNNCINKKYFVLVNGNNTEAFKLLKSRLFLFNVWLHIKNQRGLFHAAGIIKSEEGYLFFGPSGSGKSTISSFSSDLGYKVIHDDHIVVFKSNDNTLFISDITLLFPKVPLNAIFFLVKDIKNELFQLSQADTAKIFMNSFLESMGNSMLYNNFLKTAFKVSSEIARTVPGFKLHFKKSPEFWEIIREKLNI